ncbi:MAG TPA: DegT/DnrJ/EryC1/StrS family aminotransferase [Polyangiales bacterium]|nr:DegT/DnrJ/EryC1/StrS family aminotransferase [Polyangiales bacterium]
MSTSIPLVDLKAQHAQVAAEVASGFERVLAETAFIQGKDVAQFEQAFAAFSGVKHCIGVANGTDALEIALRANDIGPGDEVLVPANTFIATALAVVRAGATPRLVDCDPDYQLLDPAQLSQHINPRTRAIMPVHLFGQLAPMEAINEVARAHNLIVIEDAAQAQGATRNERGSGAWSVATGTSFYPGKNLGAYGDAGGVITDSDSVAARVRQLGNYGSNVKYHHPALGFNSRLDTLQAVVLNAKLKRLGGWNAQRRAAAARYKELLADVPGIVLPETMPGNQHIWHLFVVRVARRDEVLQRLHAAGIGAGVHYPKPIHMQGAFSHLGHRPGDFPVAERAASEILSLPMFAEITVEQQERVVTELRRALG